MLFLNSDFTIHKEGLHLLWLNREYVYLGTTSDINFNPGEDSEYWQLLYDETNATLWGRI